MTKPQLLNYTKTLSLAIEKLSGHKDCQTAVRVLTQELMTQTLKLEGKRK